MNDQSPFQARPNTILSRDDVVNYLLEQKQRGYQVFVAEDAPDAFDLILDDRHFIRFIMSNRGKPQIQGYELNHITDYYNVYQVRSQIKHLKFQGQQGFHLVLQV